MIKAFKWPVMASLVAVAVTLGGCHVFKQKPVAHSVAAQEKQVVVAPALSLESLDLRVSDIEDRMARARAARARANKPLNILPR